MTTQYCTSCKQLFMGIENEFLCPKCENQTELAKASRKRGDKETLMDFKTLFEDWKKLRKQREDWRKREGILAQEHSDREKLEREKRFLLMAVSALDCDQDLLRQYVSIKNQLNAMTMERNRLKESSERDGRRITELHKENMHLSMENMRLRFSVKTEDHRKPATTSFTKEMWRRFTQLCHPDKHDNSVAANEATRWLLENRP